jgi:hypothetical protein
VHHKKEGPEGLVLDATSVVASCAHGTAECKPAAKKDLQTRAQTFSKSATEAEWDPLRRLCTVLVRFQGGAGDPIVVAGKACVAKLAVLGGPRAGALVQAGKVQEALDFADSIASDFGDPAVKHIDAAINQLVLFAERHAANQQRLGQLGVFCVNVKVFCHLGGKFARGAQNQ